MIRLVLKSLYGLIWVLGLALFSLDMTQLVKERHVSQLYEASILDEVSLVLVDDVKLAYRVYGDIDDPVVILIHGFMGSSFDFHELSVQLSDSYRVLAFDLIGYGHSDKPVDFDYSKTHQAETIKKALEALEIDTYILGGHSMGGDIALRHTYLYPESVEKLWLFASAGLEDNQPSVLPEFFYRLVFKNYYVQRLGFNSVYYQEEYRTIERYDAMFYFNRTIPPRTIRAFSLWPDENTVRTLLPFISVDTLIIYGEEDTWTKPENGVIFHQELSQSTVVLIPETGHLPFIESLSETLAAIHAFMT